MKQRQRKHLLNVARRHDTWWYADPFYVAFSHSETDWKSELPELCRTVGAWSVSPPEIGNIDTVRFITSEVAT